MFFKYIDIFVQLIKNKNVLQEENVEDYITA
jgi:hypothetical protein